MLVRRQWITHAQAAFPYAFIFGCAIAVLIVVVASFSWTAPISRQAKEVAKDAPYCIQVAANTDATYRPADTLQSLTWLTARSVTPLHHAILVVGDDPELRYFHWSYRKQEFVVGATTWKPGEYEPAVTCIRRRNFVETLPLLFPQSSNTRYVRFSAKEAFRIPDEYQPRWSGGQSRTLMLATAAPEFAPLNVSWNMLPLHQRDSNWVFVEWNLPWLSGLMSSDEGRVAGQESAFGLQKQTIVVRGRDSRDYESQRYAADAGGPSGNTTLISCGAPTEQFPKSCQHRFVNNGRHYYFRHRPEDVPRWQEMQKRLVDLFASFEARARDAGAN
jgi:hypothetical protein